MMYMSLLDFQNALKPEAKEEFADVFNIIKKADGSEVDLRKMSWMSEYHKVFFDDRMNNESGIEKIKSKFDIKKGSRKIKGELKTVFILERTDYWNSAISNEPVCCDGEHNTIEEALTEFYGQKDLIQELIKNDALFDQRYFWKYRDGKWNKSWFLEEPEDDTVAVASNLKHEAEALLAQEENILRGKIG